MTLRELVAMAEGRQRHDWSIAAGLMSLIANTQRDPKKTRAFKPRDFDPFSRQHAATPLPKVGIGVLKQVFIEGKMPKEVVE